HIYVWAAHGSHFRREGSWSPRAAFAELLVRRCSAALQPGNSIFYLQPDTFEDFDLLLFSGRLAGIDQSINPAMSQLQLFEVIRHHALLNMPC
ncbi:MAG: hypothetical protein WAT93_10900, partial [Pontixanthobacter sp.]